MGCTKGSGCSFDGRLIWSSTPVETETPSESPTYLPTTSPTRSSSPTVEPEYYVVCGQGIDCSEGNQDIAFVSELHEVRCCKDEYVSGFETNKCENVWAASDLGGCHRGKTYAEAKEICEDYDSRLCTRDEISHKCTKGSGCSIDNSLIWSNSRVPEHYVVCGKGTGCPEGDEDIALPSELREVRCCKDEDYENPPPPIVINSCENVWAASDLGGCHREKTFAQAEGICEDYDSRLCTKDEISDKCSKGSG